MRNMNITNRRAKAVPFSVAFLIILAHAVNAATLQDIRFSCTSNSCGLEFPFASEEELPDYFQKYDPSKTTLRVAFSKTSFTMGDGNYTIDESSEWIRSVEISFDKAKNLLLLDFKCGSAIATDRNAVELRNKTNFVMNFRLQGSKKNTRAWTLANIKAAKTTVKAASPVPSESNENSIIKDFSIMPPHISGVSAQKNSEWEELLITLNSRLPNDLVPEITDSTVGFSIQNGPVHSAVFQTARSDLAKGLAWSEGKLVVYLREGIKPAVMIMKNRVLLQTKINPGRLENWQALPTGLKSSGYFLPSYEPLAAGSADFANRFRAETVGRKDRKRISETQDLSLTQAIQVKRSDASYIVTEDITSLFPSPSEGKPLEALEFGDRLKVLAKLPPFYKVRHNYKEGYVYQRDVLLEAELTTSQKDKLRRMKKDSPGGADSVAAKFGWRDNDRIIYSSYGFRDPFIEVRSSANDGINIDNLTLAGVIYENERPMALLSDNKIKGQSYTLYEGDSVKNGKILKISKNSVLFLLQEYGVSRRYTMSLPDKYGGD
jgi:hypothetical protein